MRFNGKAVSELMLARLGLFTSDFLTSDFPLWLVQTLFKEIKR